MRINLLRRFCALPAITRFAKNAAILCPQIMLKKSMYCIKCMISKLGESRCIIK